MAAFTLLDTLLGADSAKELTALWSSTIMPVFGKHATFHLHERPLRQEAVVKVLSYAVDRYLLSGPHDWIARFIGQSIDELRFNIVFEAGKAERKFVEHDRSAVIDLLETDQTFEFLAHGC